MIDWTKAVESETYGRLKVVEVRESGDYPVTVRTDEGAEMTLTLEGRHTRNGQPIARNTPTAIVIGGDQAGKLVSPKNSAHIVRLNGYEFVLAKFDASKTDEEIVMAELTRAYEFLHSKR